MAFKDKEKKLSVVSGFDGATFPGNLVSWETLSICARNDMSLCLLYVAVSLLCTCA